MTQILAKVPRRKLDPRRSSRSFRRVWIVTSEIVIVDSGGKEEPYDPSKLLERVPPSFGGGTLRVRAYLRSHLLGAPSASSRLPESVA